MMANADIPWWQKLPEDYHLTPHTTEADDKHPFKVKGTAAIDTVLRTGLASLISFAMAPTLLSPSTLRREIEQLWFYAKLANCANPAAVFAEPPRHVVIREVESSLLAYRPAGIPSRLLTFTSPYLPLNPVLHQDYAEHQRNQQAVAQHWFHADGPRPTLIFTHGYLADSYGINSIMFSLRWFYQQGYDVLLYTLPFHGYRKGRLHPFSGFGYFANGFAHVNEAMLQAVFDLRIFMNYLEERGTPSMGLSGLSLGGYISSLTACADNRLAFVIPNAPVVSPVDMVMEWAPLNWIMRRCLPRAGMSVQELRHCMAVHSALTYAPQVEPDRLLVIGGAGDRFTAPRYVKLLHEHWAGSEIHWFPGNHVMHLHQGTYLKLMKTFMDRCCATPLDKMEEHHVAN